MPAFYRLRRFRDRFLVFLYFSGHGILDDQGLLYLAVKDTEFDALTATAIPSHFVSQEMNRSYSRRQVLVLDCCYSGAFSRTKTLLGATVGTARAFEPNGYGRVILTATDATQYAWDNNHLLAGQATNSLFTHYLIEGLQTGSADLNNDGVITTDELYEFTHGQVVKTSPRQTPVKIAEKQMGPIAIARARKSEAAMFGGTQQVHNESIVAPVMKLGHDRERKPLVTVGDGSIFPILMMADSIWPPPKADKILDPSSPPKWFDEDELRYTVSQIETILSAFDAPAHVVEVNVGPTVTQFGVEPGSIVRDGQLAKVTVSSIKSLANELTLALGIDVHIAGPVPGRSIVGIEIVNRTRRYITLSDVMMPRRVRILPANVMHIGLGQAAITGEAIIDRLVDLRHLFVAGMTNSGKSNFIRASIASLLLKWSPEYLRLLMIDPGYTGLVDFKDLPHLLAPVATEPELALALLEEILHEMEARQNRLLEAQVQNITEYNSISIADSKTRMPRLVVVIDELRNMLEVDLDGTEFMLAKLAELGHFVGIHLIVTACEPFTDIAVQLANYYFPTRIALSLKSTEESIALVKQPGAERLLKRGDMLLLRSLVSPEPIRVQGAYVSNAEVGRLVDYWKTMCHSATSSA